MKRGSLKPRKPLARTSGPKRNGPIKPKKRKPTEYRRIYGSKRRVETIKSFACYACGKESAENAHLGNGGMGRKSDWTEIVDLGPRCHRTGTYSLHNLGSVEAFDAHHGTRLRERASFLAEFLKP